MSPIGKNRNPFSTLESPGLKQKKQLRIETYRIKEPDTDSPPFTGNKSNDFSYSSDERYNLKLQNQQSVFDKTFQKKSANEIRSKYLAKLMYHRVWLAPIQKPRSHQNIVILDYDDTILPTTFLDPEDEADMEHLVLKFKNKLAAVEEQVLTLLKNFLQVSKVLIITNAKIGWVEYSSSILLPKVHQMIMQYIPVISARGQFEHKF